MKGILLFAFGLFFSLCLTGQDIVTNQAQKKSVVLEEFTGYRCGFCPEGHAIGNEIKKDNPGRVILVNVHAGGYASPGTNAPDYRTDEGESLDDYAVVSGYPSGTVNRRYVNGDLDYSRSAWASVAEDVLKESSPVNVGAMTSYDETTRTLTIVTEVYFTKDSEESTNRLIIALLQDNIIGPQSGASGNPDDVVGSQYRHSHMLRDYLTGEFGLEIPQTTAGTLFRDTQVYQIPMDFRNIPVVIDDLELGIYVSNTQTDIQNGILLGLNDMNDGDNAPLYVDQDGIELAKNLTSTGTGVFSTALYAFYPGTEDYTIQVSADSPSDWSMEYTIAGNTYSGDATVTLDQNAIQNLDFNVQTGTSGVGNYQITVFPNSAPDAKAEFEFTALYDCTDLLINGESNRGDGMPIDPSGWEQFYVDAFESNGTQKFGATDADVWKTLAANGALEGINNIYMNIGWTFPAYTDDMVTALIPFLQGGGNIFMAGQDVAWDIMDNTGSQYAKDFMNNYLRVNYIDDGNASNNPVTANENGIFNDIPTFQLNDYYGGTANDYFYPDQLEPLDESESAFTYNNTNKIGAVYSDDDVYKVVYFGFGLEMIEDEEIRNALMQRVHDYFYGIVDNKDVDLLSGSIQIVPNPISNHDLNLINDSDRTDISFHIVNSLGQRVFVGNVDRVGVNTYDLETLESGLYFLKMETNEGTVSKAFIK